MRYGRELPEHGALVGVFGADGKPLAWSERPLEFELSDDFRVCWITAREFRRLVRVWYGNDLDA